MYKIIKSLLIQGVLFALSIHVNYGQNSLVGDGFGGRLWYSPTNYGVGSYTGYSLCKDVCEPGVNQLFGWGDNKYNPLGLGSVYGVSIPTIIPNMSDVKYYSAGYTAGAIKNDSTGWAWGRTAHNGGITGAPIQVIAGVKFVEASSLAVSYVKNDGTVWSIGSNEYGNFGDGNVNYFFVSTPVQMQGITNAVRVANNRKAIIVLLSDSTVWAVGDNWDGNLGVGSVIIQSHIPIPIPSLSQVIDIKSHQAGTIALTTNGEVYFWGINSENSFFYTPTLVNNLTDIVAISGCDDGFHFLALDANKNCYAWGKNDLGQCGISSPITNITTPQLVATDVIDIMAGETFSYIVKSDGSLWASGTGTSTVSIWLNLEDIQRDTFTVLDLSMVPTACSVTGASLPDEPCPANITFPNIFSPNNDGKNDLFYFPNEGVLDMNWKVYNRWGSLITSISGIDASWDGKTKSGHECSEGVYFYVLSYETITGERKNRHGHVTLIR